MFVSAHIIIIITVRFFSGHFRGNSPQSLLGSTRNFGGGGEIGSGIICIFDDNDDGENEAAEKNGEKMTPRSDKNNRSGGEKKPVVITTAANRIRWPFGGSPENVRSTPKLSAAARPFFLLF